MLSNGNEVQDDPNQTADALSWMMEERMLVMPRLPLDLGQGSESSQS